MSYMLDASFEELVKSNSGLFAELIKKCKDKPKTYSDQPLDELVGLVAPFERDSIYLGHSGFAGQIHTYSLVMWPYNALLNVRVNDGRTSEGYVLTHIKLDSERNPLGLDGMYTTLTKQNSERFGGKMGVVDGNNEVYGQGIINGLLVDALNSK